MELLLGVDGGGTHTTALVATSAGEVIGRGKAAGSNPRAVGMSAATTAILAATSAALADGRLPDDTRFAAACLGIAGAGRPVHKVEMEAWLASARLAERTLVVSDVEPIVAAGTPDGWGVALISGTGSSCFAQSPAGETLQVGGWGYLLGDEGSGYDLAMHALRLATQSADGRADADALLAAILAEWKLASPEELIAQVYERGLTRPDFAALTRPLLALADEGDSHALGLLDDAAIELARMATTARRRLKLINPPLALTGGLLIASATLRDRLAAHLGDGWGSIRVVTDPAQGTIVLARRLLAG